MSSLLYLGFSVVAFLVSYSIVFMLIPMVLGPFFTLDVGDISPSWNATRNNINATAQWVAPVAMLVGIFIFILKVLMVASVRGRD